MTRRRLKRNKAYTYNSFAAAKLRGYTKQQYENSKRAKKTWDNLPTLKKESILDNLAAGRRKQKFQRKFGGNEDLQEQASIASDYVYVYEIVSQSHYDARGTTPKGKKYKTLFEYTTKGYFENEPALSTIEKMTKNSLIAAFNSGRKGSGGYLKNSAFNKLVDANLRGVKVQKVKIKASDIGTLNNLDAELSIKNNGNKWIGKN